MTTETADTVTVTNSLLVIPLDDIHPGPNARGDIGDVDSLAMSLQAIGQLQPLIVERRPAGGFTIFDGARRHKAMRKLKWRKARAVLRSPVDAADRIVQQLALALTGKPFDPMAESDAVYALFWTHNMPQEDIARRLGHSVAWVRGRLSLHQATPEERAAVASGRMPVRDALAAIGARRAHRDGQPAPKPYTDRSARPKCAACGGTGREK